VSDDEDRTLNMLLEQLDAKASRNLLRASYYDGKRAIHQVGSVIPPHYYRLGITLGWSAKAVDMLARRCNIDRFVWPDGDLGSLGFGEFEDGNHLISRIKSGLVSSLTHGVSLLINTRGDESVEEPLSLLHVKDARSATGEWNTRRGAMDNLLSITNRDGDGKVCGLALCLDGVTITADKDGSGWSVERRSTRGESLSRPWSTSLRVAPVRFLADLPADHVDPRQGVASGHPHGRPHGCLLVAGDVDARGG